MRVEQVMFRSGAVRRAGDLISRTALTVLRRTSPPSWAEQADDRDLLPGIDRQSRNTITVLHPVPAGAADLKGAQSDDYDIS
jgi:hypothetical protein